MKKLTSFLTAAAFSVVAAQASAAVTFTMAGILDTDDLNACDLLGCTKGAPGEIRITLDDSVAGTGTASAADMVSLELWTTFAGVLTFTAGFDNTNLHATDPGAGFLLTWTPGVEVLSFEAHDLGAGPFPHIEWNSATGETAVQLGLGCDGGVGCNLGSSTHMFENVTWSSTELNAVPVPAAAWLFGSAILGLAGVGRKRRA